MPNRTIRESSRTSRTLDQLSDASERLHWRLVTVADDFGRFDADPAVIKSLCFPLRADVRMCRQVRASLAEMEKVGLIQIYSVSNKKYAFYPHWEDSNGKPRALRSKFPLPTSANICSHMQTYVPDLRSSDLDVRSTSTSVAARDGFSSFWSLYPKKREKPTAQVAFQQALKKTDLETILSALRADIESEDWQRDRGKFIPYPGKWLKRERWLDEPSPEMIDRKPWDPEPRNRLLPPEDLT